MPPLSSPKPLTFSKLHSKNLPCFVQSFLNITSQSQLSHAVSSLRDLSRKGIHLPTRVIAYLLQQCANTKSLKLGKWVHIHLKLTGLKIPTMYLANHLINMYCKCGDCDSAHKVFDKMPLRNLYSWNNLLSGYVGTGRLKGARRLFDKMPDKDVVSWNTMVVGYAKSRFFSESLEFYKELRKLGIGYNEYTFAGLLIVCVKLKDLGLSRQAHCRVLVSGFLSNVVVSSSVLDAYSKCGDMGDANRLFLEMNEWDVHAWTIIVSGYAQWGDMEAAKKLFNLMTHKNSVSWASLISGYTRHGLGHKALHLFAKMMLFGIRPEQFALSSCLCVCSSMALLKHGKQIHGYLIRTSYKPNTIVVSSLIDMYSTCGRLRDGRMVFDLTSNKQDVVLWNTMISALAQHGPCGEAIDTFHDMVQVGVKPNRVTLTVILNACRHSGLVQEGLDLFEYVTCRCGIVPDQEHYESLIALMGEVGSAYKLLRQH